MRYDVEALIYTEGRTPDGYGGFTKGQTLVGTISCVFTPLSESNQVEKYGVNKKGFYKVVTNGKITQSDFILKIHGNFYKPYYDRQWDAFDRRVIMVERIDD